MFRALRRNKGQGLAVQYSTTFFLVVGVAMGMGLYVRRAVQARIKDSRNFMFLSANALFSNAELNLQGKLAWEYEPYYVNKTTTRVADHTHTERLFESLPVGSSGIYLKELDEETQVKDASIQAPPGAAQ